MICYPFPVTSQGSKRNSKGSPTIRSHILTFFLDLVYLVLCWRPATPWQPVDRPRLAVLLLDTKRFLKNTSHDCLEEQIRCACPTWRLSTPTTMARRLRDLRPARPERHGIAGPEKNLWWRGGTRSSPPAWKYDREDLRAFAKWSRKVHIWEVQISLRTSPREKRAAFVQLAYRRTGGGA